MDKYERMKRKESCRHTSFFFLTPSELHAGTLNPFFSFANLINIGFLERRKAVLKQQPTNLETSPAPGLAKLSGTRLTATQSAVVLLILLNDCARPSPSAWLYSFFLFAREVKLREAYEAYALILYPGIGCW